MHGPEGDADGVPAEVAEAAGGFEVGVGADVVFEEVVGGAERELGGDAADVPDGSGVVEGFAEGVESGAVHEHDAVHELDVCLLAGGEHFVEVGRVEGAGLFAEDVFAGLGGFDDPLFAEAGGEGDVDGIDIVGGEEGFVAADGAGFFGEGDLGVTGIDELLGLGADSAGDGDEGGVFGVVDGVPVFAGDLGGAEDTPAAGFAFVHGEMVG